MLNTRLLILCLSCLFYSGSSVYAATYTYDKLHRLTSVSYAAGHSVFYRYDAAGNLLQVEVKAKLSLSGTVTGHHDQPVDNARIVRFL